MVIINPTSSYENAAPFVKLLFETYKNNVKEEIENNYLKELKDVKKWLCISDYSFDENKANDVITFSFIPYIIEHEKLIEMIKRSAPSEIKNTKTINPSFISFLKESPILSFSFILENHRYLIFKNLEDFRQSAIIYFNDMLSTNIPDWLNERPDLIEYHKEIAKDIKQVIQLLQENKKIRIIKNLILISLIGSFLATQIANYTDAEIIGWFSDRDAINDIANQFSTYLFQIQLAQHMNKRDFRFGYAPATSSSDEWYGELVKIPDYITGAIADYNLITNETTHDKFTLILRNFIADNSKNMFVFKLKFDENGYPFFSRLAFKKNKENHN